MATGFTIDTPLKVARFGIDSVVSLVDDILLEQMRKKLSEQRGLPYQAIGAKAEDARAHRITAYLDLLHDLLGKQMQELRTAAFEIGSDVRRYFEMLPTSPLRSLYERWLASQDAEECLALEQDLRAGLKPGSIDVNIMTKLDRDVDRQGRPRPEASSDALSALRGWVKSAADGAVVLSAGMNRRLFRYMAECPELQPDALGKLRKRIILKVSDFRSATVQGKQLAKLGLHVSEFRVESGLNCGGHAFGGKGQLLGPVLEEFRLGKAKLLETLHSLRLKALGADLDTPIHVDPLPTRVTAQGGLGASHEQDLLLRHYGVDTVGWGSAFLLVPEVVNIDRESLEQLRAAKEGDIELSDSSPLGIPFWSMRTSASEVQRRQRIASGKPGSPCPKGFLAFDTEFSDAPMCTGSRGYQKRKIAQLESVSIADPDNVAAIAGLHAKACICHDLAGGATGPLGVDANATTSVCCGPNAAYFTEEVSLEKMVDNIYGREEIALKAGRPHMFLKELQLNLDYLQKDWRERFQHQASAVAARLSKALDELQNGVEHYRGLVKELIPTQRISFHERLEALFEDMQIFRNQMRSAVLPV